MKNALNEYLENFPDDCLSGSQTTLVRVMEIKAVFPETQMNYKCLESRVVFLV